MRAVLSSAGRLAAGLVALTAAATSCQRAYRFLPAVIRTSSPGFQGLVVLNFGAMFLREIVVGHAAALPSMVAWAASTIVMLALSKSRWMPGMVLFLAASIGVDVLSAAAISAGVGAELSPTWFVAWKLVAAAVGQHQLTSAKRFGIAS